MSASLDRPVKQLAGVGPKVAERLARLGILTAGDLLNHFPNRYEDFTRVVKIRDVRPGNITVSGTVEQAAGRWARTRRLYILEAVISDETGTLKAVWFNQRFLQSKLVVGSQVILAGKLEFKGNDLALQSPSLEPATAGEAVGKIIPIYPETAGLTSKQIAQLVDQVIASAIELDDGLPQAVCKAQALISYPEAVRWLHQPQTAAELEAARRRMAFAELWFLIVCGLVIKHEVATEPAQPINFNEAVAKKFTAQLDFELTDAQRQAAWQILKDMAKGQPMHRLLEGDVGSGKTVVAMLAATMAQANGYQTALMVPTEVLALQHAAKLAPLAEALGFKLARISGQLASAERRALQTKIAAGEIGLIVGTQALLSESVNFHKLGLVIIDEQHRFGVEQRQQVKAKAGYLPHLLTMTATPIPRTLALTVYDDLDVSVIDQMPPGRQPVKTSLVQESERLKVYQAVEAEIAAGHQVYVVCPLIEDSPVLGAASVAAELERLRRGPFSHRRLAGLHGRMKGEEKDRLMSAFAVGEIDILVATSLIEVGIDVPNATVMLIEAADRFGLPTLHQLRGRVGRGQQKSYCYLFTSEPGPAARRLIALTKTTDGFRLAQIDLEERGAGQVYGLRQHGRLDLRFANLGDVALTQEVRASAQSFTAELAKNMVKYPLVVDRINQLKTVTSLD